MPWETVEDSLDIRKEQYRELNAFVDGLCARASSLRPDDAVTDAASLVRAQARIRAAVEGALGYPPPIEGCEPEIIRDEEVASDELIRSARRVWIRVAEGLTVYGILLIPRVERPKLALCYHGGAGCPELVASVVNSANYNNAARRLAELGYAPFCPLFSLRDDATDGAAYACGYRGWLDARARFAGASIASIEIFKVERALRAMERYPGLETGRVGVAGLSYGGYYALYSAALIPRLQWCVSSCYFTDRVDVIRKCPGSLADWLYPNAGCQFADPEVGALICPKPLYVEIGLRDELFDPAGAIRESTRLRRYYEAAGARDKFLFDAFDGPHEFRLNHIQEFLKTNG